ncbi:uncharacterized protein H6S33_007111 [Morchella sextelata]|uniref:uncharacterized protein n=1 Tax=Morchella sextelata TaxID=1174677 RepID=UPI001D049086|nr:uncharacterized protein H6S33_007111 [Morchella sextelata]KAH0604080.1 hypothetical protein H6S33_007111 [Morchella sextelata]
MFIVLLYPTSSERLSLLTCREIKSIHSELSALLSVLSILKQQTDDNKSSAKHLLVLEVPLEECNHVIKEIQIQLKPKRSLLGRAFHRSRWPLLEGQLSAILLKIERYKSLFGLAISAEQHYLSTGIEVLARNTDMKVRDLLDRVQVEFTAAEQERNRKIESGLAKSRARILKWVYRTPFDERHLEISGRRQLDTGTLLTLKPEFQSWVKENPDFKILWGNGIPGAGKTFLRSRVIDYLTNNITSRLPANIGVAFLYFDYKGRAEQSPPLILCSLIHQLASQLSLIPAPLESLYNDLSQKNKSLSSEPTPAYKLLLEILKMFKRVYFVFDALDECEEETQRRNLIPMFHGLASSGASVFITSRSYPLDINESFSASTGAVSITLAAQEEDLRIYIEQKINGNTHARRLISPTIKDNIIQKLVDCAKGMFLLVHFFIEDICKRTTVNEIKRSLQDLDSTLAEEDSLLGIYQRVMDDIKNEHESRRKLALKSLSWAVKAITPLSVHEFCQAVSIKEHLQDIGPGDTPDISMILERHSGRFVL